MINNGQMFAMQVPLSASLTHLVHLHGDILALLEDMVRDTLLGERNKQSQGLRLVAMECCEYLINEIHVYSLEAIMRDCSETRATNSNMSEEE